MQALVALVEPALASSLALGLRAQVVQRPRLAVGWEARMNQVVLATGAALVGVAVYRAGQQALEFIHNRRPDRALEEVKRWQAEREVQAKRASKPGPPEA